MLLRVGQLARRCGLTIRTLHHYDTIGLLSPSVRSDAGYRLYNAHDIARLHRILALRELGVSLADIGTVLDRPEATLPAVIARQIAALDAELTRKATLRERLVQLGDQLARDEVPDPAGWLTTLELMTMYDTHFTADELERLPFYRPDAEREAQWRALADEADDLMQRDVPPQDAAARDLARRWMIALERDTAGDPTLLGKLDAMHREEPALQTQLGITPPMAAYVQRAFAEDRLAIYRRYLSDEEFAFVSARYPQQLPKWPPLISELRQAMRDRIAPHAPEAQSLARRWFALFHAYAGDDPRTHEKLRQAHQHEPALRQGAWVDDEVLAYLGQAIASLSSTE